MGRFVAVSLGFGTAIAALLGAAKLAELAFAPPLGRDLYAATLGLLFLLAGLALGARWHARRSPEMPVDDEGIDAVRRRHGGADLRLLPPSRTETSKSPPLWPRSGPDASPSAPPLSPRELQVLQALAEGCSNAEIARRHFLSINTVKTHVRQIHTKLDVRRRGQAVARAHHLGLLPTDLPPPQGPDTPGR